ncbi:MAG: DsbA family protein, partial [Alphaproteobacteria bacterium]
MGLRSAIATVALSAGVVLALAGTPMQQARAADLSEKQIGAILEKLLLERPEIIVRALESYQQKQEREQLSSRSGELFTKDGDPFIGNPNGKIILVEFFDYRCGYCKRVVGDVVALTKSNKDLKVVFKELPILGDPSVVATRVSLAVNLVAPEKYGEFHKAVMLSRGAVDQASLLRVAARMGIDSDAVKAKLEARQVATAIRENYELADQLGIRGTPAFVIGDQVIPGAADKATLERLIQEQR